SASFSLGALELDPGAWVVAGLERAGLAWNVKRTTRAAVERARGRGADADLAPDPIGPARDEEGLASGRTGTRGRDTRASEATRSSSRTAPRCPRRASRWRRASTATASTRRRRSA